MTKKETLSEFIKNLSKFDDKIERMVLSDWNKNTELALSKAQEHAPVKTGLLQDKARRVVAILTNKGIESKFIFT